MIKKIIGWLHLWLGLVSGIIVIIICVTGCLFVFQKEISDIYYRDVFFIKPKGSQQISLDRLREKAQAALGASQPINDIVIYKDPSKAWEFMSYRMNDTAITYFGAVEHFRSVFIDPCTGAITGFRNYKTDFFSIVKYIHWSLLLNTQYGQPVVGWSTMIFVVLLITGLVLWWPEKWNRSNRRRSFRIMWKARFKRLNYDLHNVLGFYTLLVALVLALTGLVWSFQWFSNLVSAIGSGTVPASETAHMPLRKDGIVTDPLNIAYQSARARVPGADRFNITPAADTAGPVYIYAYRGKEVYYDYDALQFDQHNGRLLHFGKSSSKKTGEKLVQMNYDIHVGAIAGIPGKIIAFLACLVAASLPVTGFYVWWNKKKKPNAKIATAGKPKAVDAVSGSLS